MGQSPESPVATGEISPTAFLWFFLWPTAPKKERRGFSHIRKGAGSLSNPPRRKTDTQYLFDKVYPFFLFSRGLMSQPLFAHIRSHCLSVWVYSVWAVVRRLAASVREFGHALGHQPFWHELTKSPLRGRGGTAKRWVRFTTRTLLHQSGFLSCKNNIFVL